MLSSAQKKSKRENITIQQRDISGREWYNVLTGLVRFCPVQEPFLAHHPHWFLIFLNSFLTFTTGRYVFFCLFVSEYNYTFFNIIIPVAFFSLKKWCGFLWLGADWGCYTAEFPRSTLAIILICCFWIIITRTSQVVSLPSFSFCPNIIICFKKWTYFLKQYFNQDTSFLNFLMAIC